jgi:hypothetical protein
MDYTRGWPSKRAVSGRKRSRRPNADEPTAAVKSGIGHAILQLEEGANPTASKGGESSAGSDLPTSAAASPPPESSPSSPAPGSKGKRPAAPARGRTPFAPPVKETFDELARKVSTAEPHRGSVMQPPPAWSPDEVTLGFAMAQGPSGKLEELPEPTLLAAILTAVEADRTRILNQLAGGGDEEVQAVANLFWPLIVLPGRKVPEVAIFDGTGVWKRAFRYTLPPKLDQVSSLLDAQFPPKVFLERVRSLMPQFAHDPGAEVLTVEGFLPVDPPLLFDVLTHSEFRSDPQSPHAGFLPARHDAQWYRDTVAEMYRWLDRFEKDLQALAEVKERTKRTLDEMDRGLREEYDRFREEAVRRLSEAATGVEAEMVQFQHGHREQILKHAATIRQAQAAIAHGETTVATADTLAFRASHRRTEGGPHAARRREAELAVRNASRTAGEARKAIEAIHAQERADLERSLAKLSELERQTAQALAERELFRDEFVAAGHDFLQAIDGQMAARSTQKDLLAGYFIPVPNLEGVRVVWFPLWVATLKGTRGLRQIVFPPMKVRTEKRLTGVIKQFFGGVVLPVEPRTAQFDKVLRTTMEDALRKDTWLSTATQELTRAADVLVDPDVLSRLQEGLGDLARQGWVTKKQEQNLFEAYVGRARRVGPRAPPPDRGPTSPAPEGA